MSDDVPANSPEEIESSPDAAAPVAPRQKKTKSRKPVAKKAAKAAAPARKRSVKPAASSAASQVQVGDDTIFIPKALAASLTPKDLKKLRAVFKRIRKRGQKRATKKR